MTVDEDGNVIWNVDTETTNADEIIVEPTSIPETGVIGTGDLDDDLAPAVKGGTEADGDAAQDPAGTGSNAALIFGIAGGSLAILVGIGFGVRVRMQRKAELAMLEEPIDPLASEPLAGEFVELETEHAYAGAAEAGAYEEGGAAYAQFADPDYAAADGDTTTAVPTVNKLDQLRASMVAMADKGLVDAGHDRAVPNKLEAAGSKMRPGEWLVMAIGGTVGAFFGGSFLLGWILGTFTAAIVAVGFWKFLSFREGRRQKAFAEALPETLQLLTGSLRGGVSMMQTIQTVADEADEPTAGEFQRIITETRLGRDLALSLRDLAQRMSSKDSEWAVTAIEIHREVGGDLASILDRVGNTIRARNRVRGQVQALSAEGKLSGLILFFLPPGMVMAIATLNRPYLDEMIGTSEGQIMLVASSVLLLVGGAWLKRLSRFAY